MAIKLGGENDELVEAHEINVTPFIDVMLVLLIIFMVAAPLATADVHVNLPPVNATPSPHPDKPVFLTLHEDNALTLGDVPVPLTLLGPELDRQTGGDHAEPVFLRADQHISYGDVMAVVNALRHAGYLKLGLVGLEAEPGP